MRGVIKAQLHSRYVITVADPMTDPIRFNPPLINLSTIYKCCLQVPGLEGRWLCSGYASF